MTAGGGSVSGARPSDAASRATRSQELSPEKKNDLWKMFLSQWFSRDSKVRDDFQKNLQERLKNNPEQYQAYESLTRVNPKKLAATDYQVSSGGKGLSVDFNDLNLMFTKIEKNDPEALKQIKAETKEAFQKKSVSFDFVDRVYNIALRGMGKQDDTVKQKKDDLDDAQKYLKATGDALSRIKEFVGDEKKLKGVSHIRHIVGKGENGDRIIEDLEKAAKALHSKGAEDAEFKEFHNLLCGRGANGEKLSGKEIVEALQKKLETLSESARNKITEYTSDFEEAKSNKDKFQRFLQSFLQKMSEMFSTMTRNM